MRLEDFKQQFGVKSIPMQKSKTGRMIATVIVHNLNKAEAIQVFGSSTLDTNKPMFVNKGVHDAWWLGNNTNNTEPIVLI